LKKPAIHATMFKDALPPRRTAPPKTKI